MREHLRDVGELLWLMAVTLLARVVRLVMLVPIAVAVLASWALQALQPAYLWVEYRTRLVPFRALWRLYRHEGWAGVRARRRPHSTPPS